MIWIQFMNAKFEPVTKKADAEFMDASGDDIMGQLDPADYPNAPDKLPLDGVHVKNLESMEIMKSYN